MCWQINDIDGEIGAIVDRLEPFQGTINGFDRLIYPDLMDELVPVHPNTRRRWTREGHFPEPVCLGNKRGPKRIAWIGSEYEAWVASKLATRDSQNRDD